MLGINRWLYVSLPAERENMQDYNEDIVIEQLQNPATVRQAFARVVARYSEPLYWQIRKWYFRTTMPMIYCKIHS